MRIYFLIVGLLWSISSIAVTYNEELFPKVLKILDEDKVILNLGLEDGVSRGHHARFTKDDNFVTRAVSLHAESGKSLWKMYRIQGREALEVGNTLRFRALSLKQLPSAHNEILDIPYQRELVEVDTSDPALSQELSEKKPSERLDDDLNRLEKGQSPYGDGWVVGYKTTPGAFDKVNFDFKISPYETERKKEQKRIGYSAGFKNVNTEKFALNLSYNQNKSSFMDFVEDSNGNKSEKKFETKEHKANYTFAIKRLFNDYLGYDSQLTYARVNDNGLYTKKHEVTGAPGGLRLDAPQSDRLQEFSLSYLPQYEYLVYEIDEQDEVQVDDGTGSGDTITEYKTTRRTKRTKTLRHQLKFVVNYAFSEMFNFSNELYYRPAHDFANRRVEWSDGKFENTFMFNFSFLQNLSLSYKNYYNWDTKQAFINKEGSVNVIHTIEAGVNFDI